MIVPRASSGGIPSFVPLVTRRRYPRGLGLTVHGVELVDCSSLQGADMSAAYACSQANQAAIDASYGEGPAPAGYNIPSPTMYAGGSYSGSYLGPGVAPVPTQTTTPTYTPAYTAQSTSSGSAIAPAPKGGSVSFQPSRSGSLQPGDTWRISISGASPNTPVTVTGGKNGQSITNSMGTTDGAGNFS